MESLVLAFCLRVIRAGVDDVYAELEQPDPQSGPSDRGTGAPGNAIVHQKCAWEAIAAERAFKVLLDRLGLLVGTGLKTQGVARVVVDHGERVAHLPIAQWEAPLEVHLPDIIRCRVFEAGELGRLRGRWDAIVPRQDRMNRRS